MNRVIGILVFFLSAFSVNAQTYYVDSTSGNDAWSGNLPDAQVNDGPWRSLAKVNASTLLPGDAVLLKCGETWREELIVPSSGTAVNPITFSKYGANCDASNKPRITGADNISGWSLSGEGIYTAQAPLVSSLRNLVFGQFDILSLWRNTTGASELSLQESCGTESGSCAKFTVFPTAVETAYAWSNVFSIGLNRTYRVRYSLKSETANTSVLAIVRWNGGSDVAPGSRKLVVAGTNWQTYEFEFSTSNKAALARLDFQLGKGQTIYIDNVEFIQIRPTIANNVNQVFADVNQVFVDGKYVKLAQHPNPRSPDPTNTYLTISGTACSTGNSSFIAGTDLILPPDHDMTDAGIHIRTIDWDIENRTVASYVDGTFTLNSATYYSLCPGWGYYLDGKRWMLDSPGEWHYDIASQQLSIQLPNSGAPGARVEAGYREIGIDASARAYVVIDGLRVDKALTGISLAGSLGSVVRNCDVEDSGGTGIAMYGSDSASILDSKIVNSVGAAISTGVRQGKGAVIRGNLIANTGVVGSPKKSVGAIQGSDSDGVLIENNTVTNSGYVGIFAGLNTVISGNYVEKSCMVLDDCSAIYISRRGNPDAGSTIENNIIDTASGNRFGTPHRYPTAHGIYLDDFSNKVTVRGNTVTNTHWGIQIHNGHDNVVTQNTIYGVRSWAVRIQEDTQSKDNVPTKVVNNKLEGNLFFPTQDYPTHSFTSLFANNDFGSYDLNRYSSVYSKQLVEESYKKPVGTPPGTVYTLSQWQKERNHDLGSTSFDLFGLADKRVVTYEGVNLIANGTFDTGTTYWAGAPFGKIEWQATCVDGGCLLFTRDANTSGQGLVPTPAFRVQAGKSYLVRLDLKGSREGQGVTVNMTRSNPPLTRIGGDQALKTSTAWQTHSLIFKAGAVPDIARLNFYVAANDAIYLDNVTMQEVTIEANTTSDDSALLINTNTLPEAKSCPDATINPAKCDQYVRFADGNPVQWPLTVRAKGSEIVVWSQNPMRDTDHDGVVDTNDACPDTLTSGPQKQTDERGCSFTQNHTANLSVTLSDAPDPVVTGGNLTYTATVKNHGLATATNVVLTDTFPIGLTFVSASSGCVYNSAARAVTCNARNIANGATTTMTITVRVDATTAINNTVVVASNHQDPDPTNNSASVTTAVAPGDLGTCNGKSVTLRGTSEEDTLIGTAGNDVIAGRDDDDTIDGGEGDDTICGGSGRDTIRGGAGNDTLRGDSDNDQLFGDDGDDALMGGGGSDACDGGNGTDTATTCEATSNL